MQDPVVKASLSTMGLRPAFQPPMQAASYITGKHEQFSRVIDQSGIKMVP
jgi:hypothetical protein